MCRIARELGYCPLLVAGADKKIKPWCNDFSMQESCGRLEAQRVSDQNLQSGKIRRGTRNKIDGVKPARIGKQTG